MDDRLPFECPRCGVKSAQPLNKPCGGAFVDMMNYEAETGLCLECSHGPECHSDQRRSES